jgi:hypothetical protein
LKAFLVEEISYQLSTLKEINPEKYPPKKNKMKNCLSLVRKNKNQMKKNLAIRILSVLGLSSCLLSTSHAASFFMTVSGAGSKNGSSWANAFAANSTTTTPSFVLNNTMKAGDVLNLGSGDYGGIKFYIVSSGTDAARKSIIGVDRGTGFPQFMGSTTVDNDVQNASLFIRNGADFWNISNLRFARRGWAVRIEGKAADPSVGFVFNNIFVGGCRNGFKIFHGDRIRIFNSEVRRYKMQGIHFAQGCDDVTVRNCITDMTGTRMVPDVAFRQDSNPRGIELHDPNSTNPRNSNILIEDCTSMNNDQDTGTVGDFEQGDGFMVQGPNDNVTFRRCQAYNNQDSGYDAKSPSQTFIDCVSMRNAHSGYKIWVNGTMTNCMAAHCGDQVQVIGRDDPTEVVLTANFCTFHRGGSGGGGVRVERGKIGFIQADLRNCILSSANASSTYNQRNLTEGIGSSIELNAGAANDTKIHHSAAITTNAPKYVNPIFAWDGIGNDYDNATYGTTKGYNSGRRTEP